MYCIIEWKLTINNAHLSIVIVKITHIVNINHIVNIVKIAINNSALRFFVCFWVFSFFFFFFSFRFFFLWLFLAVSYVSGYCVWPIWSSGGLAFGWHSGVWLALCPAGWLPDWVARLWLIARPSPCLNGGCAVCDVLLHGLPGLPGDSLKRAGKAFPRKIPLAPLSWLPSPSLCNAISPETFPRKTFTPLPCCPLASPRKKDTHQRLIQISLKISSLVKSQTEFLQRYLKIYKYWKIICNIHT